MSITYYVVLPFIRDDDGGLVGEEPIEAQRAERAISADATPK